jgi:hypothetical protein
LNKVMGNKADGKLRVEVKWRYDQQPNPAFKQLMMLLLQPKHNQFEVTRKEDNIANSR